MRASVFTVGGATRESHSFVSPRSHSRETQHSHRHYNPILACVQTTYRTQSCSRKTRSKPERTSTSQQCQCFSHQGAARVQRHFSSQSSLQGSPSTSGLSIRDDTDINTFEIVSAGLHWSFKKSTQKEPLALMLGWSMRVVNESLGGY